MCVQFPRCVEARNSKIGYGKKERGGKGNHPYRQSITSLFSTLVSFRHLSHIPLKCVSVVLRYIPKFNSDQNKSVFPHPFTGIPYSSRLLSASFTLFLVKARFLYARLAF